MSVTTTQWRQAILNRAIEQCREPCVVADEFRPHVAAGRFPGITRKEAAALAKGSQFTTKQIFTAFKEGT